MKRSVKRGEDAARRGGVRFACLAVLWVLLSVSCKSGPAVFDMGESVAEGGPAGEVDVPADVPAAEVPSAPLPPEEPSPPPEELALPDARADFAESAPPPPSPPEEEFAALLPDPGFPVLPEVSESPEPSPVDGGKEAGGALPLPQDQSGLAAAGETGGSGADSPGVDSPGATEEPLSPPAPPAFLRPAETASGDLFREPVPVPSRPPAEAPARAVPGAAPVPGAGVERVPPERSPSPGGVDPGPLPSVPGGEVTRSRTLRAGVGQRVVVPFRGSGWVFLGEGASRRGIVYLDRERDAEGMSFSFRADEPGDFDLRFYRQDHIRDFIQNDHVRLIVEDSPGEGAVVAPRWPQGEVPEDSAPDAGGRSRTGGPSAVVPGGGGGPGDEGIVPVLPPSAVPVLPPDSPAITDGPARAGGSGAADGSGGAAVSRRLPGAAAPVAEFLDLAREEYRAGRIGEALEVLDLFRGFYPQGSDEAWWLYGQALEAAGPRRDVRAALEFYRRLLREYPQSPRQAEAVRRIAYLERFFFNIQ